MRLISLLLLLLLQGTTAYGQATVYKSVDEHGVVSFSDTPPDNVDDAQRMEINTPPPSSTGEYERNLDAMRETTDRMAADRREREKHRADLRESQARSNAYQYPSQTDVYEYDNVITGYGRGNSRGRYKPGKPGKPPWRPGYKPKPEHPIARPPYLPGGSGSFEEPRNTRLTEGNSQLMRPITGRR